MLLLPMDFQLCMHCIYDLNLHIYELQFILFPRHAKRTTINVDDVKLLARRNSAVVNFS